MVSKLHRIVPARLILLLPAFTFWDSQELKMDAAWAQLSEACALRGGCYERRKGSRGVPCAGKTVVSP